MNFKLSIFYLFSILYSIQLVEINGFICNSTNTVDQAPVIGILANEETFADARKITRQQIIASYVKFLESSGAQVVPVLLNKDDNYYDDLYGKLNGILLPGGALTREGYYYKAAKFFWNKASNKNPTLEYKKPEDRPYFPIFGICLGMEAMLDFISGNPSRFTKCSQFDTRNAVNLTRTNSQLHKNSKLFKYSPTRILNLLKKEKVTVNFHNRCMTIKNITKYKIDKNLRVLGTNLDKNGLRHVSIIEAKYYPFYGIQFHPEAVLYEFKDFANHHNVPHNSFAVRVSQYFGNFFVEETRKNKNCFTSQDELNQYLIYNYKPEFTGANPSDRYIQKYYFPI